jgi:hypothetical protein
MPTVISSVFAVLSQTAAQLVFVTLRRVTTFDLKTISNFLNVLSCIRLVTFGIISSLMSTFTSVEVV